MLMMFKIACSSILGCNNNLIFSVGCIISPASFNVSKQQMIGSFEFPSFFFLESLCMGVLFVAAGIILLFC